MAKEHATSRKGRLPVSFPVRFRPYGLTASWQRGIGLNLSAEGLACLSSLRALPPPGIVYEMEIWGVIPGQLEQPIHIYAESRWSTLVSGGSKMGFQAADEPSRTKLTQILSAL
jgi:hypothetical protein